MFNYEHAKHKRGFWQKCVIISVFGNDSMSTCWQKNRSCVFAFVYVLWSTKRATMMPFEQKKKTQRAKGIHTSLHKSRHHLDHICHKCFFATISTLNTLAHFTRLYSSRFCSFTNTFTASFASRFFYVHFLNDHHHFYMWWAQYECLHHLLKIHLIRYRHSHLCVVP